MQRTQIKSLRLITGWIITNEKFNIDLNFPLISDVVEIEPEAAREA